MKNIAIFASGNGTNAEQISKYFRGNPEIRVSLILTNNPKAFVLKRAEKLGIPSFVFDRDLFYKTEKVLQVLQEHQIEMIVLAGFMWLVPGYLINAYRDKIINIHPALLPKYGG
ncbi:MAG: phosphoribosylglycinamide formyltransferase, partial [Chlorobi bacterium]|nr:phosphoribosylglycinamide formyltransferase [Chlorobiota bacterium]